MRERQQVDHRVDRTHVRERKLQLRESTEFAACVLHIPPPGPAGVGREERDQNVDQEDVTLSETLRLGMEGDGVYEMKRHTPI